MEGRGDKHWSSIKGWENKVNTNRGCIIYGYSFFQMFAVVVGTTICTFTVLPNRLYNVLASWYAKRYLDWIAVSVQHKGKQMDR